VNLPGIPSSRSEECAGSCVSSRRASNQTASLVTQIQRSPVAEMVTGVTPQDLRRGSEDEYSKSGLRAKPTMLNSISSEIPSESHKHRYWCAAMVLFAICSLTIAVATRYASGRRAANHQISNVQSPSGPGHSRQRLIKTGAAWIPPQPVCQPLADPGPELQEAATSVSVPGILLHEPLYNRPPPASI